MSRGRWLLTFYALSLLAGVVFLAAGQLEPTIVLTLFSAPAAIWGVVKDDLPGPRKRPDQSVAALRTDFALSPWLVLLVVIGSLQLVERVTAMLLGATLGMGLNMVGVQDEATLQQVIGAVVGWPAIIVSCVAIAPISVWATHRLRRWPVAWILAGVLASNALSIAVYALFFGASGQALIVSLALVAGLVVLWLPGMLAGMWWSRRTHSIFVMSRVFKELSPADQADLVDLARVAGIRKIEERAEPVAGGAPVSVPAPPPEAFARAEGDP